MRSYNRQVVIAAEVAAARGDVAAAFGCLRHLCLDDFGEIMWSLPSNDLPNISRLLPRMASVDVQNQWTGASGHALLSVTLRFVKSVSYHFSEITGRNLKSVNMLDFGCGYGRMIRLMYYYSDPDRIWGVDPWTESLRICRENHVLGNLSLSDYMPRSLPVDAKQFDLIYCFSVFTHLSERCTKTCLETLHKYISRNGLLVITIRPEEYWSTVPPFGMTVEQAVRGHRESGFSFAPHEREPVEGEVTYGDTSMTLDWFEREIGQWKLERVDRSIDDPHQLYLFLSPR